MTRTAMNLFSGREAEFFLKCLNWFLGNCPSALSCLPMNIISVSVKDAGQHLKNSDHLSGFIGLKLSIHSFHWVRRSLVF